MKKYTKVVKATKVQETLHISGFKVHLTKGWRCDLAYRALPGQDWPESGGERPEVLRELQAWMDRRFPFDKIRKPHGRGLDHG